VWWKKKPEPLTPNDIVIRDQKHTAGRRNYFAVGPACFDESQMNHLRSLADQHGEPTKIVLHGQVMDAETQRRTLGYSLKSNDTNKWVYDIITEVFTAANQSMRYHIVPSMSDQIQILRYDAEEEGFFVWHADTGPDDMTRKMSVVVLLSDPGDYEGGKLEINQGGELCEIVQIPGKPIVFPSWLIHQVTPVTAGRRYSLVAWIRGPSWR